MPNHVSNELIFSGVSRARQNELLAKLVSPCVPTSFHNRFFCVDFTLLLPPPLNSWRGGVSVLHEKAFPSTDLDWCTKNWGTKWDAYGKQEIISTDDTLTIRFDTAWSPPRGWLCAIFNHFKISFTYRYLSEGEDSSYAGSFNAALFYSDAPYVEGWAETKITDNALHRHMHKLRWGMEEFPPEDEEEGGDS